MCNSIPDLPDSTKHSLRRGGRWYESEKGGKGSLVGLGEKRIEITEKL